VKRRSRQQELSSQSRGILDVEQSCRVCCRHCTGRASLAQHVLRAHSNEFRSMREYFVKFIVPEPFLCDCGCGEPVPWNDRISSFVKFIRGHNSKSSRIPRDSVINAPADGVKWRDDEAIIWRDDLLIRHALGDQHITRSVTLPHLKSALREHVSAHGWFYPSSRETLESVMRDLESIGAIDINTQDAIQTAPTRADALLKSLFRSFWHTQSGAVESFNNDDILDRILTYRLGLGKSRDYTYTLRDGSSITANEHFDVSLQSIRHGFVVNRLVPSWFKCSLATGIWKMLVGRVPAPVVYDPSCGFGARILSFAASFPDGTYIGCEPASMTRSDLGSLSTRIQDEWSGEFKSILLAQGSEHELSHIESGSVDAVFTSPPYFDREKYFDEPGQCWRDHPVYEDWLESYLIPTMVHSTRVMRVGAKCCINVSSNLHEDIESVMRACGLEIERVLRISLKRDHFARSHRVHTPTSEVLVLGVKESEKKR